MSATRLAGVEARGARNWPGASAHRHATATDTVLRGYLSLDSGTVEREFVADMVSTTDAPAPIHLQCQGAEIGPANLLMLQPGSGGAKTRLHVSASVALAVRSLPTAYRAKSVGMEWLS